MPRPPLDLLAKQTFPTGDGETARLIRDFDWSSTPLGPAVAWPQSLKTTVELMLASRFPMFTAWGEGLTFLYNDAYIDVLGAKHPQALGRPFHDIWSEIWADIAPLIDAAMSGQATYFENLPLVMNRKGHDEQTWFTFSYSPVRDDGGQVAGMFCACVETTGQVLADRERDAAGERLDLALSSGGGVGTWDWDVPADRVTADARFARLYGVDPETARNGAPVAEFFVAMHPDDADRAQAEIAQALATGEPFNCEYRLVQPDGEVRWVSAQGQASLSPKGEPLRFPGVTFDITDRRRMIDALAEGEARYRTLFDTIGSGFCIIQMKFDEAMRPIDYMIVEGNAAFAEMTGLHGANGKWVSDIAPGLEQHWFDLYGAVALTGKPARFENPADIFGRWYDVQALRIGDPEHHRVAILFNNITERKQLEVRQAVLLALSDALRDLTDPSEIAHASSRILAEALNVSRVGYGVMDTQAETITIERDHNAPGVKSLAGVIRFRDFGSYIEDLKRGEAVVIADAAKDERTRDTVEALAGISACALINIPLIERGEVVALVFANNATPRVWRDEEVALIREVADLVRVAVERARAAALLRNSEIRYRALFEAIDEGFCIIEFIDGPEGPLSDYVHVEANAAYAENAGIPDVVGQKVRQMVGAEAQEWIDLYKGVLDTGKPIRFEKELEKTGRWLELAAFRVEPSDRNQVAVLFNDLTARRTAELALRDSEARLRDLNADLERRVAALAHDRSRTWQVSPDLIGVANDQGYFESVNPAWQTMLGWSDAEVTGTPLFDFLHPDDVAPTLEVFRAAIDRNEPAIRFENRYRTKGGEHRWISWVAVPEDGKIYANGRDVTEEKARAEERNRLWNLSSDMLARADYAGGMSAVNPAWTQVLGWSEHELLTNPYADIISPADVPATVAALTQMGETGKATRFQNSILAKDGQWKPIDWTVVPEPDSANFIAVGRDLTEDKAREAELQAAQEALRQSQKMEAVGQLTGGIAHDFNNLLAGISGALELLSKRLAEGRLNGMERYIDAAQGSAQRAASLTQRLLAFSRRQTLDPKPTDVNRLIGGMEDLIRRSVGPDVEVEVVGAGGLWTTRVDPSQLENALLNLCINARDAMAPGGGRLTIETANKWLDDKPARERDLIPGQYVSLCVTDTGAGMTPQVQAQAFDPFFTTKPLGQGTGLGLSMIHGFVRQSGGQVRIYSEVGKGTTMCLYLPRYGGALEAGEAAEDTPVVEGGHGETVLVIDDEATVRMLVAEVLGEAGYHVIEAPDGPSGLDILRSSQRIDLLISDVGLPGGMNGRQVADAAREGRPDLKVLFITGYAENAAVGNGLLAPGMEVITKPFVMAELALKVHEMIEG